MPRATITIARHGDIRDEIDADVLGDFAIHIPVPVDDYRGNWVVTHVPTGWACLWTQTKRAALAARSEFVGSGDWAFSEPTEMTAEQKAIGKDIKRRYEGK